MNASWFRKVSGQLGFSSQTPYCAVQLFLVGFLSVDFFTLLQVPRKAISQSTCAKKKKMEMKKKKKTIISSELNYKRLHLISITSLTAISVSVSLPSFLSNRGHYRQVSVTAAIEPQPQ